MRKFSKLARSSLSHIYIFSMLVLCQYTVVYIMVSYTSDKGKMFLRQSIWNTNKILKEIAVLACENVKIF